jgi:hypothetical protein
MFKELQTGLSKFFTKKWIPIILLIVISLGLLSYSYSKGNVFDKMSDGSSDGAVHEPAVQQQSVPPAPQVAGGSAGYALHPVANPADLLPKDQNSQWAALNPVNQNNIALPDLLQAGYHIGLDTIGQTLKNANYQLRSDPIIDKKDVGPWNQSTFEADVGRVPLELGYGQR